MQRLPQLLFIFELLIRAADQFVFAYHSTMRSNFDLNSFPLATSSNLKNSFSTLSFVLSWKDKDSTSGSPLPSSLLLALALGLPLLLALLRVVFALLLALLLAVLPLALG